MKTTDGDNTPAALEEEIRRYERWAQQKLIADVDSLTKLIEEVICNNEKLAQCVLDLTSVVQRQGMQIEGLEHEVFNQKQPRQGMN
jgi:hypothetical protein